MPIIIIIGAYIILMFVIGLLINVIGGAIYMKKSMESIIKAGYTSKDEIYKEKYKYHKVVLRNPILAGYNTIWIPILFILNIFIFITRILMLEYIAWEDLW
jgi:hypothetical protein